MQIYLTDGTNAEYPLTHSMECSEVLRAVCEDNFINNINDWALVELRAGEPDKVETAKQARPHTRARAETPRLSR